MHLTGESSKERTSSGVSARCDGTIAFTHSPGDLRQRAHLMQFPIVRVATGGVQVVVTGELGNDVYRQSIADRISEKDASEVMRTER